MKNKIKYDFVAPLNRWEFWIHAPTDKIGVGNCGLFVEAKNEKQAEEYLKNLIKIIKENDLEEDEDE